MQLINFTAQIFQMFPQIEKSQVFEYLIHVHSIYALTVWKIRVAEHINHLRFKKKKITKEHILDNHALKHLPEHTRGNLCYSVSMGNEPEI